MKIENITPAYTKEEQEVRITAAQKGLFADKGTIGLESEGWMITDENDIILEGSDGSNLFTLAFDEMKVFVEGFEIDEDQIADPELAKDYLEYHDRLIMDYLSRRTI